MKQNCSIQNNQNIKSVNIQSQLIYKRMNTEDKEKVELNKINDSFKQFSNKKHQFSDKKALEQQSQDQNKQKATSEEMKRGVEQQLHNFFANEIKINKNNSRHNKYLQLPFGNTLFAVDQDQNNSASKDRNLITKQQLLMNNKQKQEKQFQKSKKYKDLGTTKQQREPARNKCLHYNVLRYLYPYLANKKQFIILDLETNNKIIAQGSYFLKTMLNSLELDWNFRKYSNCPKAVFQHTSSMREFIIKCYQSNSNDNFFPSRSLQQMHLIINRLFSLPQIWLNIQFNQYNNKQKLQSALDQGSIKDQYRNNDDESKRQSIENCDKNGVSANHESEFEQDGRQCMTIGEIVSKYNFYRTIISTMLAETFFQELYQQRTKSHEVGNSSQDQNFGSKSSEQQDREEIKISKSDLQKLIIYTLNKFTLTNSLSDSDTSFKSANQNQMNEMNNNFFWLKIFFNFQSQPFKTSQTKNHNIIQQIIQNYSTNDQSRGMVEYKQSVDERNIMRKRQQFLILNLDKIMKKHRVIEVLFYLWVQNNEFTSQLSKQLPVKSSSQLVKANQNVDQSAGVQMNQSSNQSSPAKLQETLKEQSHTVEQSISVARTKANENNRNDDGKVGKVGNNVKQFLIKLFSDDKFNQGKLNIKKQLYYIVESSSQLSQCCLKRKYYKQLYELMQQIDKRAQIKRMGKGKACFEEDVHQAAFKAQTNAKQQQKQSVQPSQLQLQQFWQRNYTCYVLGQLCHWWMHSRDHMITQKSSHFRYNLLACIIQNSSLQFLSQYQDGLLIAQLSEGIQKRLVDLKYYQGAILIWSKLGKILQFKQLDNKGVQKAQYFTDAISKKEELGSTQGNNQLVNRNNELANRNTQLANRKQQLARRNNKLPKSNDQLPKRNYHSNAKTSCGDKNTNTSTNNYSHAENQSINNQASHVIIQNSQAFNQQKITNIKNSNIEAHSQNQSVQTLLIQQQQTQRQLRQQQLWDEERHSSEEQQYLTEDKQHSDEEEIQTNDQNQIKLKPPQTLYDCILALQNPLRRQVGFKQLIKILNKNPNDVIFVWKSLLKILMHPMEQKCIQPLVKLFTLRTKEWIDDVAEMHFKNNDSGLGEKIIFIQIIQRAVNQLAQDPQKHIENQQSQQETQFYFKRLTSKYYVQKPLIQRKQPERTRRWGHTKIAYEKDLIKQNNSIKGSSLLSNLQIVNKNSSPYVNRLYEIICELFFRIVSKLTFQISTITFTQPLLAQHLFMLLSTISGQLKNYFQKYLILQDITSTSLLAITKIQQTLNNSNKRNQSNATIFSGINQPSLLNQKALNPLLMAIIQTLNKISLAMDKYYPELMFQSLKECVLKLKKIDFYGIKPLIEMLQANIYRAISLRQSFEL